MRKILKYLQVFLFWLAGLTLSAHLIIPHDHHISDSASRQESNCPVTDNQHGKHKGFPVHCHAFNDLATEKEIKHVFISLIQVKAADFNCDNELLLYATESSFTYISDKAHPLVKQFFVDLFPLRAPPVSA
jgi:hypothetical protein